MDKYSKIGIFDSGLGGLSVVDTIRELLPDEDLIYIGDSANAPYGTKDKSEVLRLSQNICNDLISKDVKAIVIACNTATSAAVSTLRSDYNLSIIGMEPAIKPALIQTDGKILVLATEMTLNEEKFNHLADLLDEAHRIIKMPVPEWVDLVENHLDDEEVVIKGVAEVLNRVETPIEGVVLGCTHYIFLKNHIDAYFEGKIKIFDGNMGTALQLKNMLDANGLLKKGTGQGRVEIENTRSESYVNKSKALVEWLEMRRHNEPKID